MRDFITRILALLVATTLIAINITKNSNAMTEENPLLATWEGPYGGVPPFDRVQVPLFKPALEAAMAEALLETGQVQDARAPRRIRSPRIPLRPTSKTRSQLSNAVATRSNA